MLELITIVNDVALRLRREALLRRNLAAQASGADFETFPNDFPARSETARPILCSGPIGRLGPDDVDAAPGVSVRAFERIRAGELPPMFVRAGHSGQPVIAGGFNHSAKLELLLAERIGHDPTTIPGASAFASWAKTVFSHKMFGRRVHQQVGGTDNAISTEPQVELAGRDAGRFCPAQRLIVALQRGIIADEDGCVIIVLVRRVARARTLSGCEGLCCTIRLIGFIS